MGSPVEAQPLRDSTRWHRSAAILVLVAAASALAAGCALGTPIWPRQLYISALAAWHRQAAPQDSSTSSHPPPDVRALSAAWAHAASRAATFTTAPLANVLARPSAYAALLVVVQGDKPPSRRPPLAPLVTTEPATRLAGALNAAASRVEAAVGRPLYPVHMEAADALSGHGLGSPWAVFEVSSGRLLLDRRLFGALLPAPVPASEARQQQQQLPPQQAAALSAALRAWKQLAAAVASAPPGGLPGAWPLLAAAAAAAAATPPLWFCFLCPIALGLLAPLAINFGLGEAAAAACSAWQLDDQSCVDLWLTALGVGLFLSLMSAIPIFKVCRMYECAHRPPPPPAQ